MRIPRQVTLSLVSLAFGTTTLPAQTTSFDTLRSNLSARESALELAFREFERTGHARVITPEQDGGFILFPFGHKRPTIRCPRLNACLIVLEPGELLTDEPLSGDTERWIIDTSVMGASAQSRLVVIKPQDCDISTNVLIPTDRRVYELDRPSRLRAGTRRRRVQGTRDGQLHAAGEVLVSGADPGRAQGGAGTCGTYRRDSGGSESRVQHRPWLVPEAQAVSVDSGRRVRRRHPNVHRASRGSAHRRAAHPVPARGW